jgi:hypothetical protein
MNFLKPSYMLELKVDADAAVPTDAQAVFRAHSTTLWNYTNTITETADKKQAQAYWCRVNKKKLATGLYVLDASDRTAKRFLANKKPRTAISRNYLHFVYTTGTAKSRLFCLWQFIDEDVLDAVVEVAAAAEEAAEAVVAEAVAAEAAEATVDAAEVAEVAAADAAAAEETIRMLREQLEMAEAAKPFAAPIRACLCASAIMQIESRLSALEVTNSYALQLGVILGLSSANASAEEAPPADEAESADEAEVGAEDSSDEESADEAEAEAGPCLVIDTKRITNPFGANPAKVGDIIIVNSEGVQYYVEVKTVNTSYITFKPLKHLGGNMFRYSNSSKRPADSNFIYTRRLYKATNGRLQGT